MSENDDSVRRAAKRFNEAGERSAAVARTIVGLREDDAKSRLEAAGCSFRVVERDGESLPCTMDFQPSRVNVSLTDGVVTSATVG